MLLKAATIFLIFSFSTATAQSYCRVIADDIQEVESLSRSGMTREVMFEEFMANRGSWAAVDMAEYATLVLAWVFTEHKDADDFIQGCND